MRKTLRITSVILVILIFVSTMTLFSACKKKEVEKPVNSNTVKTDNSLPTLEVEDFEGYEFKILWPTIHSDGHFIHNEIAVDEMDADVINSAVKTRNDAVESTYNVKIMSVLQFCSTIPKTVRMENSAGESSYDALCTNIAFMSPIALEGVLADFNSLKYYDENQEWWNHKTMQGYSIANLRYFGSGDIIYSDDFYPYCVYVNNDRKAEVGLTDNLFDAVRNRTWTLEKVLKYAADAAEAEDPNSPTVNDYHGIVVGGSAFTALYYSAGKGIISLDRDGYAEWEMTVQHTSDIIDKLYSLVTSGTGVWIADDNQLNGRNQAEVSLDLFNQSKCLFATGELIFAERLVRSNAGSNNYSIFPVPLYDEDSEYRCLLNDAVVVGVPVCGENLDRTSLILSAMSRESVSTLTPAFFETVLTARYMQNPDSVDMLQLILDSEVVKDVATIQDWGGFKSAFQKGMMNANNKFNFASYYQSNIGAIVGTNGKIDEYNTILENR